MPTTKFIKTLLMLVAVLLFAMGCQKSQKENANDTNNDSASNSQTESLPVRIALEKTTGTTQPDGWKLVTLEEHGCKIAWPENFELSADNSIELDDGDLVLALGIHKRDQEHQRLYTLQAIVNLLEAGTRAGDTKLVSETKEESGMLVRRYANHGDEYMQIGRIIAAKEQFWFLAVTFKRGNESDPRIAYYFENFSLLESK